MHVYYYGSLFAIYKGNVHSDNIVCTESMKYPVFSIH